MRASSACLLRALTAHFSLAEELRLDHTVAVMRAKLFFAAGANRFTPVPGAELTLEPPLRGKIPPGTGLIRRPESYTFFT